MFRRPSIEVLEQRCMLAVVWANELDVNGEFNAANGFANAYQENAIFARAIVNRAIDDWNAVVLDQNFDNDSNPATTPDLELSISATDFGTNGFGAVTTITEVTEGGVGQLGWTVGVPTAATIQVEDDNDGLGWFFDTTPNDDAEFSAIASAFQSSFVDVQTGGTDFLDFYLVVAHEIGHALGISLASVQGTSTPLRLISGGNLFLIDWDGNGFETDTALIGGGGVLAFFSASRLISYYTDSEWRRAHLRRRLK